MATGKIQVNSSRTVITTSSTDTGDFFGNLPTNGQPYSFPFPGTIIKVSVNSILPNPNDLDGGTLWIVQGVGSDNPFLDLVPGLSLGAGVGIQEFVVNYPFAANDGFLYNIGVPQVGAVFNITLEIEYSLV